MEQKYVEDMALTIRDSTIIKVVRIVHHQGDIRCGISRVYNAHACPLSQQVGHCLDLQVYGTNSINLDLLAYFDTLTWRTCHKSSWNFHKIRHGKLQLGCVCYL